MKNLTIFLIAMLSVIAVELAWYFHDKTVVNDFQAYSKNQIKLLEGIDQK